MPDALVSRRIVAAGAAWTVPVILVGQPASAEACSASHQVPFVPDAGVISSTANKPENGHTLGTFTWTVCNKGKNTIPANTTLTATFTADKAPGSGSKSIKLSPRAASDFTVSPNTVRTLNPDGGSKGETTVTMTLSLKAPLETGACATQVWDVDSDTGVGATKLRMTVALAAYGNGTCGVTGEGGTTSATAIWGAGG